MTNRQLLEKMDTTVRREREITNELLQLIAEAIKKRAYLEMGYPSMFDCLTRRYGYSGGAAYRRIEAAELLVVVPHARDMLQNGQTNLTNLSKARQVIKAHQRAVGRRVTQETAEQLVAKIEGASATKAEQILLAALPEAAPQILREHQKVINETTIRRALNFDEQMSADLQRAKELLSHKFPNASDAQTIATALRAFVKTNDPLEKAEPRMTQSVSAAETERVIDEKISKAKARLITLQKAEGKCTFRDPVTGVVCGARVRAETDHTIPVALGGTDDPENLRVRCRPHNIYEAEKIFGKEFMEKFRRKDD